MRKRVVTIGAVVCVAGGLNASEPEVIREAAGHEHSESERAEWFGQGGLAWHEWSRVTGDWGGARSDMEEAGVVVGGSLVVEWTSVWEGGVREKASGRGLIEGHVELDMERLAGLSGGRVFAQYVSASGEGARGGSLDVGDVQGVSNLELGRSLDAVYELWYEQVLGEGLRVKVGKVDANSEFAFVEVAGEFAHSSAGFSPTVAGFPSYPDPAMSVNVFAQVAKGLEVGVGVYDGASGVDGVSTGRAGPATFFSDDRSDDYALFGQLVWVWGSEGEGLRGSGRASVGGWWHTGEFEALDVTGSAEDGTGGVWVTLEQRLVSWGDGGGVDGFVQYGLADEAVVEVGQHVGTGLVARGFVPGRGDDSAGVYVSWADLSEDGGFEEDETAVEVYYRARVAGSVWVQPMVQVVVNPGGDEAVDDAVVGGMRVGVAF